MKAQGTTPPPPAPSTMCAPPVASSLSPAWAASEAASKDDPNTIRILFLFIGSMASVGHDVALHRREDEEQLVLLAGADAIAVERVAQPLHQQVHLGLGVLEALVHLVHRVAGVLAAAARERADLLDDLVLHVLQLHVLEGARGARVARGLVDGLADHPLHHGLPAQPAPESRRLAWRRGA